MIKVLLVDDDILSRVGLKMLIDWKQYGFIIVGEASNGEEALKMCANLKPDLVVTDMKMPLMDGTSFISTLKENYPWIKILILSCYDDYAYMKAAIKCGASDYILKSELDCQTLIESLEKIRREIIDTWIKYNKDIQRTSNEEDFDKLNRILLEYLKNPSKMQQYWGKVDYLIKSYFPNISKARMAMATVKISDNKIFFENFPLMSQKNNDMVLLNNVHNLIEGVVRSKSDAIIVDDKEKKNILLLFLIKEKNELIKICNSIIRALKTFLSIEVTIGVSNVYDKSDKSLPLIYQESLMALETRLFIGKNKVIDFLAVKDFWEPPLSKNELSWKIDELFEKVYEENQENLLSSIESLFNFLINEKNMILVKNAITEFVGWYNKQVNMLIAEGSNVGLTSVNYLNMDEILLFDTFEEIRIFFISKIEKIIEFIKNSYTSKCSKIVRNAMEYIRQNYNKDISLEKLSDYIGVSKSYLCYIFKKETGKNIIEYLNDLRVEKAKILLKNTDFKIYEIATKVGFKNERYFTQIFKAKTGFTPTEYRNKIYN